MNLIFLSAVTAGSSAVVTLSGHAEIVHADTAQTTAGVIVAADGFVRELVGAVATPIDTATDWIIPRDAASSTYDVRVINVVGDAFTVEAAAENTWIDLGSDRQWSVTDTNSGPVSKSIAFDIEIRDNGGTTVASGSYSINADYEV